MVIAFWNIKNNLALDSILIQFVREFSVDVLILSEYKKYKRVEKKLVVESDVSLSFLEKAVSFDMSYSDIKYKVGPLILDKDLNSNDRLKVVSRLSEDIFTGPKDFTFSSTRWTAFQIKLPNISINLFGVHFPSKLEWSDISQAMECSNLANDIVEFEKATKCQHSIVIGDFNMNPFEPGMVSAIGLNARQNKIPVQKNKVEREIDGRKYKHFYNPMWNFFGDGTEPIGTCYFPRSEQYSPTWNIFDQVLVRDELRPHVVKDSVRVITKIGENNLLNANKIIDKQYSDHLPILITLNNV